MAAKKTAKKKTAKKTAEKKAAKKAKKKTAAKKAAARPAAKKAPAKKAPAKKAGAKKAGAGAKKASGKKASPKKSVEKPASGAPAAPAEPKAASTPTKAGAFTAADVHMGHIFSLRPRVTTAFRPEDLRTAKHTLGEETFESAAEAARAVADKALELLHDGPGRTKKGTRASRRW